MPVFITSKTEGFRRCGVVHSAAGKSFPDDFFTEEQLKMLNDDPEIFVVAGMPDEDKEQVPETAEDTVGGDVVPEDQQEEKAMAIVAAAGQAFKAGDTTTGGKPSVDAMEKILGCNITAAQRDDAWETWNQFQAADKEADA